MRFTSGSVGETVLLGEKLGRVLCEGDVVAFSGDLGAGKTAFSGGVARGLGISEAVTSPTYTVIQEYEGGRLPLFHFDLYRLDGEEELFDLGFEEYFYRGGVCLLEWSERAREFLSELEVGRLIWVELLVGEEENDRVITISDIVTL